MAETKMAAPARLLRRMVRGDDEVADGFESSVHAMGRNVGVRKQTGGRTKQVAAIHA